ncbi:hypothetical protein DB296_004141 [Escherichia coli]|nr:hypothetical protein [Escherichia coli]EHL0587955.1 hypothetical protein [Escherichia coli]
MTEAKMPDALRLSGLHEFCNLLNLQTFVGRVSAYGMDKAHFVSNMRRISSAFLIPQHIPASYSQSFFIL